VACVDGFPENDTLKTPWILKPIQNTYDMPNICTLSS